MIAFATFFRCSGDAPLQGLSVTAYRWRKFDTFYPDRCLIVITRLSICTYEPLRQMRLHQ